MILSNSKLGAAVLALSAGSALGGVVFSEDFTGESHGALPNSGGQTWFDGVVATDTGSVVAVTTAVGNAQPSLGIVDTTNVADYVSINLGVSAFSSFNMASPEHSVFKVAFDFRADAFNTTAGSGSTLRFSIKDGSSPGHNFTFGIARNNVDNDTDQDIFLYAGDSGALSNFTNIGVAEAIGLSNGAFVPALDLGTYDSTTASNNNTATADNPDGWYRIELTFTHLSTSVNVKATRLADNASFSVDKTVASAYLFSNTGSDGISVLAPGGSTGIGYFDEFEFTTVPEPAALSLLGLGALGLARRRRV